MKRVAIRVDVEHVNAEIVGGKAQALENLAQRHVTLDFVLAHDRVRLFLHGFLHVAQQMFL